MIYGLKQDLRIEELLYKSNELQMQSKQLEDECNVLSKHFADLLEQSTKITSQAEKLVKVNLSFGNKK